jgi:hypothetical protein
MAPCVMPLPRVSSETVISSARTTRSKTARRVGSASARGLCGTGLGGAHNVWDNPRRKKGRADVSVLPLETFCNF